MLTIYCQLYRYCRYCLYNIAASVLAILILRVNYNCKFSTFKNLHHLKQIKLLFSLIVATNQMLTVMLLTVIDYKIRALYVTAQLISAAADHRNEVQSFCINV